MTSTTVNKIAECFTFPTFARIGGQPTHKIINKVNCYLNANTASVQSDLGGGAHGHLALAIIPAILDTLSATLVVIPLNPGLTPEIPANSTAAQIKSIRLDHTMTTELFIKYDNTDKAIKQQLVRAIDPLYFKAIRNKYVGFGAQTCLTMLQHLYTNYAKISASELLLKDAAMKADHDANLPIENLFEQIDTAVEFAAAGGAPYTSKQILIVTFQLIFKTGVFPDDCKLWKRRVQVNKTYAEFKLFFTVAHLELRESQATTLGGGFHANSVTQT